MESGRPDKWIEINLDAVERNLQAVRSLLQEQTRLIAVVKADAYGHGAVETARLLSGHGVDYFAVSFFREALQLRQAGITGRILIFTPLVEEDELREAIRLDLTITVASPYDGELLTRVCARPSPEVNVHLKLDTGLGRFGLQGEEVMAVVAGIAQNPCINIEGIYTHMADAADNPTYTRRQFAIFMDMVHKLEVSGLHIPLRHCANSAVLLKYPEMQLDAVRVGTLLSGQKPVGAGGFDLALEDPFKFKTKIVALHCLEKGSYLAYYRSYRLKKTAQVAVIPVGFRDGLGLQVANKPSGWVDLLKTLVKTVLLFCNVPRFCQQVNIKGINYPVRGKVFMQMALVEIPLERQVSIGDEVEVPVRKTLVFPDVAHVYMQHGEVVNFSTKEGGSESFVE